MMRSGAKNFSVFSKINPCDTTNQQFKEYKPYDYVKRCI